MNPKVSIILNCHNGEEFLKATLDSISNQSFSDYEIVFYDNCSTDGSSEIAKGFGDKLKYFKSDSFISLGAARNEALKCANGEYIAFIDSDDLWEQEKLLSQVTVLERNKEIGICFTNFFVLDMLKCRKTVVKSKFLDEIISFEDFVLNYSYCLSTFMIRRQYLEQLHLWFDERLHYAEEYDLFLRMSYNCKSYCVGIPLVTRRIHSAMNSIKLSSRIPEEHQIALNNIRTYVLGFDQKYPLIVKKISYLRDYMDVKANYQVYKNAIIRKKIRPYIYSENRAFAYYVIACFPKKISTFIMNKIYKNHI